MCDCHEITIPAMDTIHDAEYEIVLRDDATVSIKSLSSGKIESPVIPKTDAIESINIINNNDKLDELSKWFNGLEDKDREMIHKFVTDNPEKYQKYLSMDDDDKWYLSILPPTKQRVKKFIDLFSIEEYFKFCETKDYTRTKELGSFFNIVADEKLNDTNKIILLDKYRETALSSADTDEQWNADKREYIEMRDILIKSQELDPDDLNPEMIANYPASVRARLKAIHAKTRNLTKTSPEYNKRMEWFNVIKKLPVKYKRIEITDNKSVYLKNIQEKLDQEIFGMESAKRELMAIISAYIDKNDSTNNCVALLGPSGIGKTQLIMKFAELIDMPFGKISVGNCGDDLAFNGCGYSYQHSEPGMLVKTIISMGFKSGIILLDEIDKVTSGKIFNILLHLIDFTQNKNFEDIYLDGIPIDMSGYLFVYTLNDLNVIPNALRSRISENLIELAGYTPDDKFEIVTRYSIPKYMRAMNIDDINIKFTENAIRYIITHHNTANSEGMREINGVVRKVLRLAMYHHDIGDKKFAYPVNIDVKIVRELLYNPNKTSNNPMYV